jgi:hypothetical protein
METINDIDVNLINKRTFDTARRVQGTNTAEIQKNLEKTGKYYDHVNKAATQRAFAANTAVSNLMYHKNTDLVAQMNESWNTNRHFHLTLDSESKRVKQGNKTAKVDVYRMRQEELQLEYTRNMYDVKKSVVIKTGLIVALCTLVYTVHASGKLNKKVAILIIAAFALLYTGWVLKDLTDANKRRDMDWERYYWKSDNVDEGKGGKCE